MSIIGRKNALLLGQSLVVLSNVIVILLSYMPDDYPKLFVGLNVFARFVGGCGDSLVEITVLSLVSILFKDNAVAITSSVFMAFSFGDMIGPILGSFIYASGGYSLDRFVRYLTYINHSRCYSYTFRDKRNR